MEIDRERLKQLASDPTRDAVSISKELGLGKVHNLYYQFEKHPELKTIYHDARVQAQGSGRKPRASKKGARAPQKRASGSAPPPQEQCQATREQ